MNFEPTSLIDIVAAIGVMISPAAVVLDCDESPDHLAAELRAATPQE